MVRVKNVAENGDSRWQMVNSGDNIKLHIYRYGKHCSSCSCQQKSESETNQTCKEGLGTFPNDGGGNGYEQQLLSSCYIYNNIIYMLILKIINTIA